MESGVGDLLHSWTISRSAILRRVGLLPGVTNMEMQDARTADFSPSDFAFPGNAFIAVAGAGTETILIADVKPRLLKQLHEKGSVRNLLQRRSDLVTVQWRG